METDTDRVAALEAQRARLEENINKIKKSLQHWQQWSFEYDALKEELEDLPHDASSSEVIAIGNDFEGDVLDQKEIDDLLGVDKQLTRTPTQVITLLSKRIDYVQRNVETVKKQLDAAELQLADLDVVSSELPAGLPMTEITEQLDEEGNVTSSNLSRPGDAANELIDSLKKAGVEEEDLIEDDEVDAEKELEEPVTVSPSLPRPTTAQLSKGLTLGQPESTNANDLPPSTEDSLPPRRKSVTFASATKDEFTSSTESHAVPQTQSSSPARSSTAKEKEAIKTQNNFDPNNRIIELGEDDEEIGSIAPSIPIEESEEDAAMRREMLAYSMNEMGSIVAQLDLDADDASVYTEEEVDEDGEDQISATEDEDEDENEFGMNTKGVIDEEYRKEMEELEQRLNARYFENMGPSGADLLEQNKDVDVEQLATHTARIAVKDDENMPKRPPRSAAAPAPASSALKDTTAEKPKKGVRFSNDLDVAPVTATKVPAPVATEAVPSKPAPRATATPGVRDTILERAPAPAAPAPPSAPEAAPPKVSRFKAARAAATSAPNSSISIPAPPRAPTSRLTTPADSPLAPKIIERLPTAIPNTTTTTPSGPDELDPALIQKQVAEEYYRQRNKRIGKQGGFRREAQEEEDMLNDDDEEEQEVEVEVEGKYGRIVEDDYEEEEEEEQPKKMSLFRKARLKREGGW